MSAEPTFLILPGLFNSGPEHWQSRWQSLLPKVERVEQQSWDAPQRADWVAALDAHLAAIDGPVVLVGHSLGSITAVHWARRGAGKVVGALLVAPADVERDGAPAPIVNFAPIPLAPLPFPAIVVASDDDPYAALERSEQLASAWGAELVRLSGAGHINGESGLGDWPQGRALLGQLLGEQVSTN